ncbi:hypothetical protein MIMGU_mgv11b014675mg [Erythranthe guttata]|uniref:Uncharacterized protein n=1 Tax=Erythranthe guttata TaxID=4155 RepID=A0A022RW97_ERYGU|nr:hypothetical protein MIMGU_mgv11b014675mg [Erythranthe guttata]
MEDLLCKEQKVQTTRTGLLAPSSIYRQRQISINKQHPSRSPRATPQYHHSPHVPATDVSTSRNQESHRT